MATFSARDAQVVQPTRCNHDTVREAIGEITQDIFDNATDLHASECMFAAYPDAGQSLIGAFLLRGQFTTTRLFFG